MKRVWINTYIIFETFTPKHGSYRSNNGEDNEDNTAYENILKSLHFRFFSSGDYDPFFIITQQVLSENNFEQ